MKCLYKIILVFALLQGYSNSQSMNLQISNSYAQVCSDRNGVLVPMPGSCTGFFICINGYAIASSCGSFYHFNARTGLCEHPLKAACLINEQFTIMDAPISKPITYQTLPKPKYPIEVIADLNVGPICENLPTGTLLPKSGSCTQYYVCILERPYRRTCPAMLHFNATKHLCQDPAIAQCIKPFEKLDGTEAKSFKDNFAVNVIMTSGFDNINNSNNNNIYTFCKTSPDGTFLPYPGDCKRFIICIDQQVLKLYCPVGHHYSSQYKRCEWPSIAKCQTQL